MKGNFEDTEKRKLQSAIDHSENSRNSYHGYMEIGNDAEIQQKARVLRNKNNRTENVH